MKNLKVVKVNEVAIYFEDGYKLYSHHDQDCCESHDLNLKDITLSDFDGLEFDLTSDTFFERIKEYGIALLPVKGFPVRIAGHGHNNGYYTDNLKLIIENKNLKMRKEYDITECQTVFS